MVPKFRAWDERVGFTEVSSIDFFRKKIKVSHWEYGVSNFFPLDEVVLMQSTGLKDKNGMDIFEGDILNIIEVTDQGLKEYLTDVKWEDCSFVVKSGGDDYDTFLAAWTSDPNTTYPLFEIQVVGNIYENLQLLEQANEN